MILFIGGGFIASALSRYFFRDGIEHRIISRNPPDHLSKWLRRDTSRLTENDSCFENVHTVIYCAHSSVPHSSMQNIAEDAKCNIGMAISLFEIFSKKQIRVIYISSGGSVYGNHQGWITEEALPAPVSAYGVSKYTIENYLRVYHHNFGLRYDVLRLSNVYGPGQNGTKPQGVVSALAKAFLAKSKFEIWGDGTAKKDYLYIDDAVDAIARVAFQEASINTFNVSAGESMSILEIIGIFEKACKYEIEITKNQPFTFDVQQMLLDNTKFSEAYTWKPRIGIEAGIEKTLAWMSGQS